MYSLKQQPLVPNPSFNTSPRNILVWQWSRFGGPPLVAVALAQGLATLPGVRVALSLSRAAEVMNSSKPPHCDLPVDTYSSRLGFLCRLAASPIAARRLESKIAALRPTMAICAQPGPLDLVMALALRRLSIPMVVLVHDADHHPGDGNPLQMQLQRALCRRATAIGALSSHVGARLVSQGLAGSPKRPLIQLRHPPLPIALPSTPPRIGEPLHLLSFGRLLPYKGLDLLADALALLDPLSRLQVRVVGTGPESAELERLRSMPNVTVENRWVPETEVGALLAWADALVLPYREASQSGVAALALAAGRRIIATDVGGLREQLDDEPLAALCAPEPASLANALSGLVREFSGAGPLISVDVTARWAAMACSLLRQFAAGTATHGNATAGPAEGSR